MVTFSSLRLTIRTKFNCVEMKVSSNSKARNALYTVNVYFDFQIFVCDYMYLQWLQLLQNTRNTSTGEIHSVICVRISRQLYNTEQFLGSSHLLYIMLQCINYIENSLQLCFPNSHKHMYMIVILT